MVADLQNGATTAANVERLAGLLRETPGVAFVGDSRLSPDGALAVLTVIPTGAPADKATTTLLEHLRRDVLPASGVTAYVGGEAASNVDFAAFVFDVVGTDKDVFPRPLAFQNELGLGGARPSTVVAVIAVR